MNPAIKYARLGSKRHLKCLAKKLVKSAIARPKPNLEFPRPRVGKFLRDVISSTLMYLAPISTNDNETVV